MSNHRLSKLKALMRIEPEKLVNSLEEFIKEQTDKQRREGVIFGLSGGIDSAVIAALCKNAVGPEKTTALILPEKDSEKRHAKDAISFAQELGIKAHIVDISYLVEAIGAYSLSPIHKYPLPKKLKGALVRMAHDFYEQKTGESLLRTNISGFKGKKFNPQLKGGSAYYRVKHRIRMVLLYYYGELENALVLGAANKSEYRTGFFVKHGCDDAADLMPLFNLYKTQVRVLARFLGIPAKIRDKPPSPDLVPGITDEKAIGMPYEKLDMILMALEEGWSIPEIAVAVGMAAEKVTLVSELVVGSEHMRKRYVPPKKMGT